MLAGCSQSVPTGHGRLDLPRPVPRRRPRRVTSGPAGCVPGRPTPSETSSAPTAVPSTLSRPTRSPTSKPTGHGEYPALFAKAVPTCRQLISWDPTESSGPDFCGETTVRPHQCRRTAASTTPSDGIANYLLPEVHREVRRCRPSCSSSRTSTAMRSSTKPGSSEATTTPASGARTAGRLFRRRVHAARRRGQGGTFHHRTPRTASTRCSPLTVADPRRRSQRPDSTTVRRSNGSPPPRSASPTAPGLRGDRRRKKSSPAARTCRNNSTAKRRSGELPVTEDTARVPGDIPVGLRAGRIRRHVDLHRRRHRMRRRRRSPNRSRTAPSTNTIGIRRRRRWPSAEHRRTPRRRELMQTDITGDYNAYVLVASRYTLAMQQRTGQALDDTANRAARGMPVRSDHRRAEP